MGPVSLFGGSGGSFSELGYCACTLLKHYYIRMDDYDPGRPEPQFAKGAAQEGVQVAWWRRMIGT